MRSRHKKITILKVKKCTSELLWDVKAMQYQNEMQDQNTCMQISHFDALRLTSINLNTINSLRNATFCILSSLFCLVLHMSVLLSFYAKLTSIESSFWAYFAYCCSNRQWHAHFMLRHFQFQSSFIFSSPSGYVNDTFPNLEQ